MSKCLCACVSIGSFHAREVSSTQLSCYLPLISYTTYLCLCMYVCIYVWCVCVRVNVSFGLIFMCVGDLNLSFEFVAAFAMFWNSYKHAAIA